MFRCTGKCTECGRCISAEATETAKSIKEKMLVFPEGFTADTGETGLGVAFDMGTTTVAGMLWDLECGRQLSASARVNPQREFGEDVISRIAFCGREEGNLLKLRQSIIGCMNDIIKDLCVKAERSACEIVRAVICGNTTMSHIFAGQSPMSLALAPFHPAYEGTLRMAEKDSLLRIPDDARVTLLSNIAGHVGGDITAGLLASKVLDMPGLTLFIDLGTNGEIVLTEGAKSYACTTAAGPAFGGAAGRNGLTGSELINLIAGMLDEGEIDRTGKLEGASEAGEPAITQKDIRDVQLAKGAIRAGIEIMLKQAGRTAGDIERIVIAGAFGSSINRESIIRIGMLPEIATDKIICVGNAAGAGVSMALVSRAEMEAAERIPGIIKHIELAEDPDFQDVFLGALGFEG